MTATPYPSCFIKSFFTFEKNLNFCSENWLHLFSSLWIASPDTYDATFLQRELNDLDLIDVDPLRPVDPVVVDEDVGNLFNVT